MPTSAGQPIQPEQPHGIDPQKMRQLAGRLRELQSVDQSVCIDAVLEELDPSIRPVYRDSIEEYLQSVSAAQSVMPNVDTLTPEESEQNESIKTTDRVRDDATVDLPSGFKAPPRDRALPPAKRPAARDRCYVGSGEDHLPLPEKIGKFRIKGELGRGACGVVYLGFDEELQRNVAIKVSLVADTRVQERLRVEASKAAQIDSDGIVPVYHIGTTDAGAVYVVQKYIQGTNLRAILEADGPVPPARAVSVIGEIALALEPAHSQNILHRDLKPDNILVDENGKLWIADFGLAISEEEQQGRRGELAGTPVYMSPEQIKGRIDFLDARSDIWALGVMLYELLSGKLPFNGKDRKALTDQICELDPRPLHQRSPKYLTEDMNNVFARCCAKQPSDRFASARELTHALEVLIAGGLGEQNINGETVSGFVGDSPIDYDTLGTRFSASVTGHLRSGSTVLSDVEEGFAPATPRRKNTYLVGGVLLSVVAGLLALVAFELPNAWRQSDSAENDPPGRSAPQSAPQSVPPNEAPIPEVDSLLITGEHGSKDDPWIVATDEPHTHETIQAAIDRSVDGDHILVMPGNYEEALLIKHSLTITGTGRGECVLLSSELSPITIEAAATSAIRIRQLEIDGSGVEQQAEFNTIELNVGELVLENCLVRASNHNCIKAGSVGTTPDGAMSVMALNTVFRCREGFAVSMSNHTGAEFQGCDFVRGSGIQLINGPGAIHCCSFFGEKGLYLSSYSNDFIHVGDCQFDKCVEYGLVALDGVTAVVDTCFFDQCGFGCKAGPSPASPVSGNVAIYRTRFSQCRTAATEVTMGKLLLSDDCLIEGGNIGVIIGNEGFAKVVDTQIADVSDSAIKLISGVLDAQTIDIQRAGNAGIEVKDGSVTVNGGQIVGSQYEGIVFAGGTGDRTIEDLILSGNYHGVAVKSGQLLCREVEVTGGDIGFFVENADEAAANIVVTINGATLGGQQSYGVFVSGNAVVNAEKVGFGDLSEDERVLSVKGGSVTLPNEI